MIRRISKKCDYRDIIKSCPTGVIDDIHTIKYFIAGHPETEYEAEFTKKGSVLEVILPSSELELLSSGILMRRALYSDVDPSFPDGEYNLEFVDNLNVWLGEDEVDPPFDPGWLTEEDLKTINGESLVGPGNIDVVNYIPDYYATHSWVQSQSYLTSTSAFLSSYVTSQATIIAMSCMESVDVASKDWVTNRGYITAAALSGYATESWVSTQQFATESWVSGQGYLTEHQDLTGYATESWVENQGYLTEHQDLSSYATQSWVESQGYLTEHQDLSSYATQSWVLSQGYITSENIPSGLATQSWVSSNFLSTSALEGYATESWVQSQGYLTSHQDLSSYATKSWVSSNFLSATALTGYATQSWVQSQGYLTSHQDLSSYATKSWVQDQNYASQGYVLDKVQDIQLWVGGQDYATQSWVSSHYLSTTALTGYATQSWVQSQGYLRSDSLFLSSFATKSWVSDLFLEESKVWVGTNSQWNNLTVLEKAQYKIALVTW